MALPMRTIHRSLWIGRRVYPVLHASFSSSAGPPQQVSPNISFHASPKGLPAEERPLVLLYSWLVAKAKHMHKFGDFYLQEGCDVLHIKLSPTELLRPVKAQAVVKQILDFANAECSLQPVIAHGFSVGCYLYAETLVQVLNEAQYRSVGERIRGQVLDSPVDYKGVPFGIANALTSQPLLRKTIEKSLHSYLSVMKDSVTQHYERASNTITENALRTSTLVFYSHGDIVADVQRNEEAMQEWRERGIHVEGKCFPDSIHVGHYVKYPKEYISTLASFLQYVLRSEEDKIQERIDRKIQERIKIKQ